MFSPITIHGTSVSAPHRFEAWAFNHQFKSMTSLSSAIHHNNVVAGWWSHPDGSPKDRNVPEMLCLIHSEISEAMEGHRKDLSDDKLPHYKMLDVELADALIRILDLAGARGVDLGQILKEKLVFNSHRADHKPEVRNALGGKAF